MLDMDILTFLDLNIELLRLLHLLIFIRIIFQEITMIGQLFYVNVCKNVKTQHVVNGLFDLDYRVTLLLHVLICNSLESIRQNNITKLTHQIKVKIVYLSNTIQWH